MKSNGIKRLAIFVVYDKNGIVDDYITYYLKELRPNVGSITDQGIRGENNEK